MRLSILIGLAALVTGCGEMTDEFINGGYDESFQATCQSSFQPELSKAEATAACNCTMERINKQFSELQKLTMSADDVTPIMTACLRKTVK